MDYKKHYFLLTKKAQTRQTKPGYYYEKHHILPRCLGGTDDPSNLIKLTPEEHYTAHLLLVKMYPDNDSLVYAANKMTVSSKNTSRNNKRYGWLKRRFHIVCKNRVGEKNSSYGRLWYHNPTTLEAGKFLPEENPNGWIKGRVPKHPNNACQVCGVETQSRKARWCKEHRPSPRKVIIKQEKTKRYYNDDDKIFALKKHNGNIRQSLLYLGLNDSGEHYKKMKKLKALVYPQSTKL